MEIFVHIKKHAVFVKAKHIASLRGKPLGSCKAADTVSVLNLEKWDRIELVIAFVVEVLRHPAVLRASVKKLACDLEILLVDLENCVKEDYSLSLNLTFWFLLHEAETFRTDFNIELIIQS